MKTTANYGLKKPEGTDVVNIEDLNYNADVVDAELAKMALKAEVTAAQTAAQSYADSKIAALVNSSPATMDTLKELADALGNDANYAATTAALIGTKETPAGAQAKVNIVAGAGRTTETVKGNADAIAANAALFASQLVENVKQIGNINDPTLDSTLKGKSLTEIAKVLFTNADNGQKAVANSLIAKGVSAVITDTFTVLASKINAITFDASKLLTGNTVMAIAGTMPNNGSPSITLTTNGATKVIPAGYSPGGTVVANIDNLVPSNIIAPQVVGGVTGIAINGAGLKKYASGTMTSQTNGNVTVSGLDFTPATIVITSALEWIMYSASGVPFEWNNKAGLVVWAQNIAPATSSAACFSLDELGQYVRSTGFSIFTGYPKKMFTWEAWS
ncbi:hypothetical protein [Clostridium sp. FP1]|uniref:hypothetical protein n=1 Tax=Clostridium sp. FP1 TaxID=2724076 RepID=UPI0013E9403C|nr:hypothetical protein [Clostridium sp. FP1]MBZ9635575.1 hypothetical protein [Clostridium sp. FP1]